MDKRKAKKQSATATLAETIKAVNASCSSGSLTTVVQEPSIRTEQATSSLLFQVL
jgi:hypothetical protein